MHNQSPPLNGGSTRVLPYLHCSSLCAFSPPLPPPAATFKARIILDSATPLVMRGSGIPRRYASGSFVGLFAGLLHSTHRHPPTRTASPRLTPIIIFFPSGFGEHQNVLGRK
jgi:hypothetical protein